jgi:hypothetical protein
MKLWHKADRAFSRVPSLVASGTASGIKMYESGQKLLLVGRVTDKSVKKTGTYGEEDATTYLHPGARFGDKEAFEVDRTAGVRAYPGDTAGKIAKGLEDAGFGKRVLNFGWLAVVDASK